MHTDKNATAPTPPTRRLLLATGLAAGTTLGIWAVTGVGHLAYGGIPPERLASYVLAGLVGVALSVVLGIRYLIRRHRRDAWWDGWSASEEPGAEIIHLSDLRGYEGNKRRFVSSSPG